ncbi:hypothetical protein JVT61DRAFT_7480 [Boletus reticuloceps]|uniref:Protein kinase domain-containing protein n=1 Tax=Boletus reticuloceps TaxID=495285 RepID=A0A8I3A5Q8_9AGAM|nr:hypothetical protein JVT61DRAFT_7480 [Boletus reticuloceps]
MSAAKMNEYVYGVSTGSKDKLKDSATKIDATTRTPQADPPDITATSQVPMQANVRDEAVYIFGGTLFLSISVHFRHVLRHLIATRLIAIDTFLFSILPFTTRCMARICISGPYILFAGSILVDIYCFQPFTDFMHPGGELFMTKGVFTIAKIFDVFRNALSELKCTYGQLQYHDLDTKDFLRLFPKPTYLSLPLPTGPQNINVQGLVFEKRFIPSASYQLARRASFLARLSDGQQVIVKFCERYNPDAHRAVREGGYAPKLLFHTQLRGGAHMVVMEYIQDGKDAPLEFRKQKLPHDVVKQVKVAITPQARAGSQLETTGWVPDYTHIVESVKAACANPPSAVCCAARVTIVSERKRTTRGEIVLQQLVVVDK